MRPRRRRGAASVGADRRRCRSGGAVRRGRRALPRSARADRPSTRPTRTSNAAVAALCVAADAVWDEPSGTVQHGAVAWRSRLLGWRGPYAMDALGWHDRARRHLTYWAGRQNTGPIPPALPPPDASANLARSEAALHSNGDMSNSHYDMNLVYIDALVPAPAVDGRPGVRAADVAGDRAAPRVGAAAVPARVRPGAPAALRGLRGDLGERRPAVPRRRRHSRVGLQLLPQPDGGAARQPARPGRRCRTSARPT